MQQVDTMDAAEGSAEENESRIRHLSIRAKISRACVACRASKTRCIPIEGQDSCESCFKRSRPCLMPGPPKPRMKSSQKFSELERKIESLSNALASRVHDEQPELQLHDSADKSISNISESHLRTASLSKSPQRASNSVEVQNGVSRPRQSTGSVGFSPASQGDMVDQGFVDIRTAEVLVSHWNTAMRPLLPILSLPPGTTASQLRESKPILFLAILAVASASILPSFETRLVTELNEQLARQIFIQGNQSMELINACLLYSQYYIRPAGSQNFAYTQYVSAAMTMCYDLGLEKKVKMGQKSRTEDVKEAARALMVGWYAASTNAVLHRQQCLIPQSSDLPLYMQILSSDSPTDMSDQVLCSLVRLQMIFEDVSSILSFTVLSPIEIFDQPSTRYKREMFQQRLKDWKESAPAGIDERLTNCAESFCNLYIHHLAIRSYTCKTAHSAKEQPSGMPDSKSITLTSSHFEALCQSLDSSQEVLNIHLSFEDSLTRSLPNTYLLWTLYAVVCLIKLTPFTETVVQSQDSAVDVSGPSVSHYLDALIEKLSRVSQNGYLPQAKAYETAFRKLRVWYSHKREVCINANGACETQDAGAAVYSVFGQNDSSSVPGSAKETNAPSNKRIEYSNGNTTADSWQGDLPEPPDGRRPRMYSSDISMQTPDSSNSSGPGHPAFETSPTVDAVYNPSTYANTNWDDLSFGPEAIKEFDTYMMDEDDSWMRYLV